MTSKRDRQESSFYKKEHINYNRHMHSHVHKKKVEERRQTNIEKYGVEREPLSKEELELLIKRQEEEALRLKRKDETVKAFNEKEWLGDDNSEEETDLEDSDDSEEENLNEENSSLRKQGKNADSENEKVRFMQKFDFEDEADASESAMIYISGLQKKVKESKFKNTFEEVGAIKSICFPVSEANNSLGWAIIEYFDVEAADKAIEEYNDAMNRGKKLNVMKFNKINEFFIVQDTEDLEIEEADEVLHAVNKKVWDSASKILKLKLLTYLTWKQSQEDGLSKREDILLGLLKNEQEVVEKELQEKKELKASRKRKERTSEVRNFTEFSWTKKSKKRKKK